MADTAPAQIEVPYKKGDQLETVHGEKITVVEVRFTESKTKKGVVLKAGRPYLIAKSGGKIMQKNKDTGKIEEIDALVQFPLHMIKGYKKPEKAAA